MKKILFIAGTRPEAIKLAPIYLEMQRRPDFQPIFCATGQHADLFQQGLEVFGIKPDITLETMHAGQSLTELTGVLFREIGAVIDRTAPDMAIAQGDTASAYAGAWAAFLQRTPVLHVEAGLRTSDIDNPFPEEANRRAISLIAKYHAAPTQQAQENLLREGIPPPSIILSGNTSIDALLFVKEKLSNDADHCANTNAAPVAALVSATPAPPAPDAPANNSNPRILVTGHRRENFGAGLDNICTALCAIAQQFPHASITYVLHPNPAVSGPVRQRLSNHPNIQLLPPLNYPDFIKEMLRATLIISDSGGIQEEAPALGKPVLVTRTLTERPEAIATGANQLVGTNPTQIINATHQLLTNPNTYKTMSTASSPYGTGQAAKTICNFLEQKMEIA